MAVREPHKSTLIRFNFPLWQQDVWEDKFFLATKGYYLLFYRLNEETAKAECHMYMQNQKQSRIIKMKNILKGWGFICE